MIDFEIPPARKLGKRAPRYDRRTLLMANYVLPSALPAPPASKSWVRSHGSDFGMMLNDSLGDCTCAAAAHMIQVWTSNSAREITIANSDVLAAYEAVGGYKPGDPNTDQGAVELDLLNYWRNTGIGGRKIDAYVAIEPVGAHVRTGIYLFGGAYSGFALPITAQDQRIWSVVPQAGRDAEPGSWGGHAVPLVAYDAHFVWCITWGKLQAMTWSFVAKYMDEAYIILSKDWLPSGKAPSGFDYTALQADLARL